MNLREISSDVALSSIILANRDDHGTNDAKIQTEYFYAEIPSAGGKSIHRFLYVPQTTNSNPTRVIPPVQLGRQVLAAVLKQPDLAHWKACVVDQDKETEMSVAFRESFANYDALFRTT
jgi:hypothetical protein